MQTRRGPRAEDSFSEGFYNLPSERSRHRMSAMKLAELLADQQPGTVQHILVEHELNLRIAGVQAMATYWGAVLALLGVVVGWFLQALTASLLPPPSGESQSKSEQREQRPVRIPEPPASALVVPARKPANEQDQAASSSRQASGPQK